MKQNGRTSTGPSQKQGRQVAARAILLVSSAMLVVLALLNILFAGPSTSWPAQVTVAFIVWGGLYVATTYRYFGSLYLFCTAYIISLAIFHMGYIIAHAVGWEKFPPFVQGDMVAWYVKAGWYCILSFGALGCGIAASLKIHTRHANTRTDRNIDIETSIAGAYEIGAILFIASIAALVFLAGSVGNILRFSRAEIFGGVGDTRGFGFFLSVAPSAMVLMATSANTKLRKLIAYPLATLTLFVVLFLGYRSNALFPVLIGAIIWTKLGKRIPLYVATAALAFVIIVIPVVSYLRAQGPYQDVTSQDIAQSIEQADAGTVVTQLGGVAQVIAYTLKWVPAEDPYRYGQSYLLAVIDAIPNLTLSREEGGRAAVKRGGIVDKEKVRELNPADWFTFRVSSWLFNSGGGTGYSTIAEAYLNFGLPGVVMFFGSLGFLLGRVDQTDLQSSPKTYLFTGALLWPLLKTVRNSIGVFMKPAGFILLTIALWKLASFWRSRRQHLITSKQKATAGTAKQKPMEPTDAGKQLRVIPRSGRANLLRRRDTHEDTPRH